MDQANNQNYYWGTAFVSCSLKEEDKNFNNHVEGILEQARIKSIGTVGKHSLSPINPAEHMRQNIPISDIVVIIATPRYFQKDLHSGLSSYGLSEMVHVEAGMAYMAGKPVIVFVQEGTHIGNFLPNITQYITLNGSESDFENKLEMINSLMENTYKIVKKIKDDKSSKEFGNVLKTGFAFFGGLAFLDAVFSEETPRRKASPKQKGIAKRPIRSVNKW